MTPREVCDFLDAEFARVVDASKARGELDSIAHAGAAAGMMIKTGFALAAHHGCPKDVIQKAAAAAIEEAYAERHR